MDRLALVSLYVSHVLVSNLPAVYARAYVRAHAAVTQQSRVSVNGRELDNMTPLLPDVSVKTVSVAQVPVEVSEACVCSGQVLDRFPVQHLASCLSCAHLRTSAHRVQRAPSCSACCVFSHLV